VMGGCETFLSLRTLSVEEIHESFLWILEAL